MRQESPGPARRCQPRGGERPHATHLTESPERVAGHISEREGSWLTLSAAGKVVLEIGGFRGRSTIYLAKSATKVVTCDHFRGQVRLLPGQRKLDMSEVEREWHMNMAAAGLFPKVTLVKDDSRALGSYLERPGAPRFDLIFIDGGHDFETISSDVQLSTFLRPGGVVAFHDFYGPKFPEVRQVVDDWFLSHRATFRQGARVGAIQAYERITRHELCGEER